jgi:hypothetical protein
MQVVLEACLVSDGAAAATKAEAKAMASFAFIISAAAGIQSPIAWHVEGRFTLDFVHAVSKWQPFCQNFVGGKDWLYGASESV